MREELQNRCEQFIRNRDVIKNTYKMENIFITAICANIFLSEHKEAEPEQLKKCKEIMKEKTGVFSNFRSSAELPVVSMLAVSENPGEKMEKAIQLYTELKKFFFGSEYLVIASMLLTDMVSVEEAGRYISRGKEIYNLMKKEHPLLTSGEDSVFAVLLAFSEKSDSVLIEDMERCYHKLKMTFSDSNAVQSLAQVLSLAEGTWEAKCAKVEAIYTALKNRGRKYSRHFEISVLGAAAILPVEQETLVSDIMEADEFLSAQKGYSGVFGIDKKTRLMHAAMLANGGCSELAGIAATTGTLAMVAAQHAAMCCAISSSIAASTAASVSK